MADAATHADARQIRGSTVIEQPMCRSCGNKPCRFKEWRRQKRRFHAACWACYATERKANGKPVSKGAPPRAKYLKDQCECCGFVPLVRQQLQLDHTDGNRPVSYTHLTLPTSDLV